MAKIHLIALSCVLFFSSNMVNADVILHAFNWKYQDIAAKADEIASAGYKMVLVSPPLKSSGKEWWARYQPQDYRVIDNPLGNTHDFSEMIQTLNRNHIRVYADVVLNHMANESSFRKDLNYPGQKMLNEYRKNINYYNSIKLYGDLQESLFSANDFGPAQCISDYSNVWQVQHLRLCGSYPDTGLPKLLDTTYVVQQQKNYLSALKRMGVQGFRVDAAKHMTIDQLNHIFTPELTHNMQVFGELIVSGGVGNIEYERFMHPFLQNTTMGAYDFPLFSTIYNAFKPNGSMTQLQNPLGYGQALQPDRSVTFVITHDIPNNSGFRNLIMDPKDEQLAYAYILGKDGGTPVVYSDHNESGDRRWVGAYKTSWMKAMVRFHNENQGLPMTVISANNCYLLFKRGDGRGLVGINKCTVTQTYWLDTNKNAIPQATTYQNLLDNDRSLRIDSNWVKVELPPRSASMWLSNNL